MPEALPVRLPAPRKFVVETENGPEEIIASGLDIDASGSLSFVLLTESNTESGFTPRYVGIFNANYWLSVVEEVLVLAPPPLLIQ